MKKIIILLALLTIHCGDTAILRDPFRIMTARYENKSEVPILHSGTNEDCNLLFHKRFYNVLFLIPMNSYSVEEIDKIRKAKSIRYKNVMLTGDIVWTILGFLGSFITYSVELEECKSNYLVISQSELNSLGQNTPNDTESIREIERLKSENRNLEKELQSLRNREVTARNVTDSKPQDNVVEIPDIPILTGYSQYIKHNLNPETQDYIVVFEKNQKEISTSDKRKIKIFADNYKKNYNQFKILLLGHADWKGDSKTNIALSLERVKAVKAELVSQGISNLKIYTTASGSYWPGNNEEKSGREFFRRVDMLFLE